MCRGGTTVSGIRLQVVDELGADLSSIVHFSLLQEDTAFAINAIGTISLAATATADYEITPSYTIVVVGTASRDETTVRGSLTITIALVDVLERIEVLDASALANTIVRSAAQGSLVRGVNLQARDEAGEVLSDVIWSLASTPSGLFAISSASGVVRFISETPLATPSHTIVVSAQASKGGVTIIQSLPLVIEILDILEGYAVSDTNVMVNSIEETAKIGSLVSGLRLQVLRGSEVTTAASVLVVEDPERFICGECHGDGERYRIWTGL